MMKATGQLTELSLSRQAAFIITSFHDSVKSQCHTQLCCDDGPEAAEAGCQFVDNVDYVMPISRVDLYNYMSAFVYPCLSLALPVMSLTTH